MFTDASGNTPTHSGLHNKVPVLQPIILQEWGRISGVMEGWI